MGGIVERGRALDCVQAGSALGLLAGSVAFSLLAVFMPILLMMLGGYVLVGLFVGLGFVLRGVDRVDDAAGGSPIVFRIVILPGCVGLWPVVLLKWVRASRGWA